MLRSCTAGVPVLAIDLSEAFLRVDFCPGPQMAVDMRDRLQHNTVEYKKIPPVKKNAATAACSNAVILTDTL
jgi:hypothetical protein